MNIYRTVRSSKKSSVAYISILKCLIKVNAPALTYISSFAFLLFAGQQERIFRNSEAFWTPKEKSPPLPAPRRKGKVQGENRVRKLNEN